MICPNCKTETSEGFIHDDPETLIIAWITAHPGEASIVAEYLRMQSANQETIERLKTDLRQLEEKIRKIESAPRSD
jgi:hypothetical protein